MIHDGFGSFGCCVCPADLFGSGCFLVFVSAVRDCGFDWGVRVVHVDCDGDGIERMGQINVN